MVIPPNFIRLDDYIPKLSGNKWNILLPMDTLLKLILTLALFLY